MSVSSIMGQYESEKEASTTKKAETSDKEMFLKLLVAQLTYQDPLNPAEDTEFIAQLAQFTQVEELQNIGGNMKTMLDYSQRGQMVSATNLIGKTVVAKGEVTYKTYVKDNKRDENGNIVMEDDGTTPVLENKLYVEPVYYSTPYDVVTCTITVLDASNNLVYSEEMGPRQAGQQYTFAWTGLNSYGQEMKDGYYKIAITGKDAGGTSQLFSTEIGGKVQIVENINGEYYLHMADGRSVKFVDVAMVGATAQQQ
jgi:flagellar basal-body rod modification protein FlgD